MGGSVSRQALDNHKKHLSQLCGPSAIHIGDPFWAQLAQTPLQLSALDPREVQKVMEPYCQQLVVNSRKTQNFQTLIVRILGVICQSEDPEQRRMAANGICFLKFMFKSLLEKLPGPEFLTFIDGPSFSQSFIQDPKPDSNGPLWRLVTCLLDIVANGALVDSSYVLMVEAIECLLVGCSTQLYVEYVTWADGTHPVLEILMEQKKNAAAVIQNLMEWYIKRLPPPSSVKIFQNDAEGSPSIFRFVRKAAVSMLWLPVTAYKYLVGSGNESSFSPLADAAQHLLLVLVHHVPYTTSSSNPYRSALRSLHDVKYIGGFVESDTSHLQKEPSSPSICFSDLYVRLSKSLHDERGTLMLYTTVQCIHAFRDYALVRNDLQTIILPILKQVYEVSMGSQSQLYLLSIVLLIFSQDTSFSQAVHSVTIAGPEWYKERPLGKITLGSFLIVLLLRMVQANLVTTRDLYLHTNTMAALANITCSAVRLDSYAAQKLMALVDLLTRKHKRLQQRGDGDAHKDDDDLAMQFHSDFLQMTLEVLNGSISSKPENNPNLLYAVLQRQALFEEIAHISPEFAELVETLQVLLDHFNNEIDKVKAEEPQAAWTVQRVLDAIRQAAPSWTSRNPPSIPKLRFSYEEEQSAEQFFVPVVWTLIVAFYALPWNSEAISLFSPQTPTASAIESEDMPSELPSSSSVRLQEV